MIRYQVMKAETQLREENARLRDHLAKLQARHRLMTEERNLYLATLQKIAQLKDHTLNRARFIDFAMRDWAKAALDAGKRLRQ